MNFYGYSFISYLDADNDGFVEVADYERLLSFLGFDPGGGGGADAATATAAATAGKGKGAALKGGVIGVATISDACLETLQLFGPKVNFDEFFLTLVLNDFPERSGGEGGGGGVVSWVKTQRKKKCCCSIS